MCFTVHLGFANPFARCPRKLLYEIKNAFEDQYESKLLMGFEIEFVPLDESSNLAQCLDRMIGYSMTASLRTKNLIIMEEIVAALQMSGIEVYHFHAEIVDRFEIALSPLPPMQAIDALMIAQETVRTICMRHGLRASMTPKPVFDGPQSGCHVHLSLNPAPEPTYFLADVLRKPRSLCAFDLPYYDSYYRVAGNCAGEWVAWGTHNKDLPIRQFSSSRWEFGFLDATANMYLFTAALLSSGMPGIKQRRILTIRDCQVVPSALSVEEAERQLQEYGITERIPSKFEVSLDSAKCDKIITGFDRDGVVLSVC